MPDILQEFMSWYLAPWRRIGRKEFGIALTIATLPGLVLMILGWGSSAGHFMEPLLQFAGLGQNISGAANSGNLADLQLGLERLQSAASGVGQEPVTDQGIDWTGAFNSLLMLGLIPLTRMRLRDMGWFGWQELAITVVLNVAVVSGLVESLLRIDLLPMSGLFGVLNFAGYLWLSVAKGKARQAVHERTEYMMPTRKDNDEQ